MSSSLYGSAIRYRENFGADAPMTRAMIEAAVQAFKTMIETEEMARER